MTAVDLEHQVEKYDHNVLKFQFRRTLNERYLADISDDFHKQYGTFASEWERVEDACTLIKESIDEYMEERSCNLWEMDLLIDRMHTAETKYAAKRCREQCIFSYTTNSNRDRTMLTMLDDHIRDVERVYRVISSLEEDDMSA